MAFRPRDLFYRGAPVDICCASRKLVSSKLTEIELVKLLRGFFSKKISKSEEGVWAGQTEKKKSSQKSFKTCFLGFSHVGNTILQVSTPDSTSFTLKKGRGARFYVFFRHLFFPCFFTPPTLFRGQGVKISTPNFQKRVPDACFT